MENAIARGKATIPTIIPAVRSLKNVLNEYVLIEFINSGLNIILLKELTVKKFLRFLYDEF